MKKLICAIVFLGLVPLLLSSCGVDFYANKRPSDQEGTRWVSDIPVAYFDVGKDTKTTGKMSVNGGITEFYLRFWPGNSVDACLLETVDDEVESEFLGEYRSDSKKEVFLFTGVCEFSEDKCIVTITKNYDSFLPTDVEKITFVREELEEDSSVSSS